MTEIAMSRPEDIVSRKKLQLANKMTPQEMSFSVDLEMNCEELVLSGGAITAGEKNREKMKNHKLKLKEKEDVSRAVCALLNSGGGVVKATVKNQNYNLNRDGTGLDLVSSFRNMLPVFHEYLDFRMHEGHLLIFVTSWILGISGQHLITLKTNLYIRAVSSSNEMNATVALWFLRNKRGQAGKSGSRGTLTGRFPCDESPKCPAAFFNETKLTFKDEFPFTAFTHLEIKWSSNDILKDIVENLPQHVSAFANTCGGYLFFGIDRKKQQIIGFEAEKSDLEHLESEIEKCIRQLPVYHFCEEKPKIKYSCRFIEVHGRPGGVRSYVCALRVERFCCVVFAKEPDSWHVEDDCVKLFTMEEWVKLQMDTTPGFSEQTPKMSLQSCRPPCIPHTRSVYANSECQPQNSHLPEFSTKLIGIPETLCMELFSQHKELEQLTHTEMGSLRQGMLIFSKSWSLGLGRQEIKGVICRVFQIPEGSLPTLYYVVGVGEELEGKCTALRELGDKLKDYSKRTALTLKHKLASLGVYTEKIGIVINILYIDRNVVPLNDSDSKTGYPTTYYLTSITRRHLQKAVDTVLSSRSL